MFLNYESQRPVALGDIFLWDGKKAEFDIVERCSNIGLKPIIQTSDIKSSQLFNSRSGVNFGFSAKTAATPPTMEFRYKGASRFSMQAYETKVESVDYLNLATQVAQATSSNGLLWNDKWIVVTDVWKADAFTQIVAGGKSARAGVSANSQTVSAPFNIADFSIGVSLSYGSDLTSQQVAQSGAVPFFIGRKYRSSQGMTPHFVRYGH